LKENAVVSVQVDIEPVGELARARALLHPMRLRILDHAREPASAATIAHAIGEPRQKVSYHVRELARARLLRRAGRRKKRNMVEQRYVATARSYVLAPELLGPLEADWRRVADTASAAHLLAVGSTLQSELGRALAEAAQHEKRIATLSINAPLRFTSAAQRAAFSDALRDAVTEVVGRFASPYRSGDGAPADGRPYRLVVGCYPIPPDREGVTGDE
jgi:DNA-binding transcriptional ArsR family regulator